MSCEQPPKTHPAIRVSGIAKRYAIYSKPHHRLLHALLRGRGAPPRSFSALEGISFDLQKGEVVGIIGRNGSGKSTLLQILAGTMAPSEGDVLVNGRIAALLELGSGFNPEFTGRENIILNAAVLGLSDEQLRDRLQSMIDFAEIGNFIDLAVKTYSSGMVLRLAFAVQAHVEPDVLLIDEALAVGDAAFQVKCYAHLRRLVEMGTSILFVSHDRSAVLNFCSKALYLQGGRQVFFGDAAEAVRMYEEDLLERKAGFTVRGSTTGTSVVGPPDSEIEERLANTARAIRAVPQPMNWANRSRIGTKSIEIQRFALFRGDDPIDLVWPNEDVRGVFLVRAHADLCGQIHAAIHIRSKEGFPIAVVRDSNNDAVYNFRRDATYVLEFKTRLPLRGGDYFCQVGVLLFAPNDKFAGGHFNFEGAEICDLVEPACVFTVGSMKSYAITDPVLFESSLALAPATCS